ncbi:MAG: Cna B-type domain-containing protein, partial [Lachnospiraceae bacterium]|nr:Cna B-type domain-containing protein [Lachnospiraceae bacterium]
PERFQNMVGAVINKANVGTSMALSKESMEVSFTVTKNWDDDNNRDGLRPSDLDYASKVHLMNGNTEVTGVTLVITDNNDNTYTISYGNLNKHINGENTDYKLKEDSITGYTPSAETVKNGETLVNTHTPETVDISITKNWVDVNNQDGIRPTATEYMGMVHLMKGENADNEVEGVVPVVTDNGNGTYTVKYTGLPKKENGTDIQYSVKEDILDGYKADTYTVKNGETITNTHDVGTTYISITKAWSDGNNQDGKRPSASQFASMVKLYRDNDVEVKGVTPVVEDNLDGTYKISYENLPKNSNGQPIEYSIKEENVDGYTADKTVVKNGETLTNTHMPETFTLIVTKSWNDDGNRDGLRPGTDLFAGKLSLMKNNTVVEGATPVVRDNGNNTYTIEYANLQKYENGTEINYSVKEDGVDGYTADKTAAKNGETITNTHTPEVIDITVTKNWVDDNNRDGIRPGANDFASKLHLMNGETEVAGVVPSVVDNNDGTYTVKYTNLAKNAAGTPITYSVKEDAVSGYTTDNNTALNGGVITNTHTPERTNVVVTMKWDDNNNQDRVRPGADEFASKLHLLADGTEVDGVTAEVVDNNDGTYTVTYSDILKYENGNIIVYGITEDDIAGYSSAQDVVYEGEVLVNVHKVKENNGENGGNKDNTDNKSKNNLNNKSDKKVDTADHSNNMIYYVLIVISATGIISAAAVAGRKKH